MPQLMRGANRDRRSDRAAEYHAWYKTKRWQKLRLQQLLSSPLCRLCWARGIVAAATVADHVVPHGGDPVLFWGGELQSLCASCHSGTKQQAERRGYSAAIGADGWPTDPRHPINL